MEARMVFLSRAVLDRSSGHTVGVNETEFNDILEAGGWRLEHAQWVVTRPDHGREYSGWECLLTRDLPVKKTQQASLASAIEAASDPESGRGAADPRGGDGPPAARPADDDLCGRPAGR